MCMLINWIKKTSRNSFEYICKYLSLCEPTENENIYFCENCSWIKNLKIIIARAYERMLLSCMIKFIGLFVKIYNFLSNENMKKIIMLIVTLIHEPN